MLQRTASWKIKMGGTTLRHLQHARVTHKILPCTAAEKQAHAHAHTCCCAGFTSCLWYNTNLLIVQRLLESIFHLWRKAEGRMTRPSGCLMRVRFFSPWACLCVCIRMGGNLDVIREDLVCPVWTAPSPRNNFLMADVLYNQRLITLDHGSASFKCNVMPEHTHTRSHLSLRWVHTLLWKPVLYLICTDWGVPGWMLWFVNER